MPVRHVQKYATPAPQIAKENQEWNNVKSYAWLVLMHVISVPQHAEVWIVILHNQPTNVPKPAVHVPKNVKSIHTWSLVKNAPKNAESVKQNVKSVRQNAKLFSLKISQSTSYQFKTIPVAC